MTANEFNKTINECCRLISTEGWRITDKVFCDPSKRRIDPIAAMLYFGISVTKEQADSFYVGFLKDYSIGQYHESYTEPGFTLRLKYLRSK